MSDLATKQYVIDMIGRYVGQSSGGGGTVPDDPAGIIQTCKDYTDAQITTANTYAETVAGNARADAEAASNAYAAAQAETAMNTAEGAAKDYTDTQIAAANDYAEAQAAAAMNEANETILKYVRARFTELDYEFRDVAITNAWQDIYYADVDRPAVLANKHIISTMIVQTYGGSPMGVYLKSPADTSQIRFTSPVSKTMHITVRFVLLNRDDGETT